MRTRGPGSSDEGLRALYDGHAPALLGYAMRLTDGDRVRAEDIVQETLLRAWRNLDQLDGDTRPVRPWLFTVAQRLAIDAHRARKARPPETGDAALEFVPGLDQFEGTLDRIVVTDALDSLSQDGEVSAHYYFRDFSRADTGVVPFLVMLELLSRAEAPLSGLLEPFRSAYFITGEINTPVADVDAKLRELEERYAAEGARISHLDGVSVDFDDWHFNVRPSNTEPLLRLNLEALDEATMEARRDEVVELIRS